MSDTVLVVAVSALVNGGVVWGVMRTHLQYLRRDVDRANKWIDKEMERRGVRREAHG